MARAPQEGGDRMKLYSHQKKALELTEKFNRCAYYVDMGGG